MDCETYHGWMTEAALGALDPAREARLRAHLEACAACGEEFRRAQTLAQAIELGVAASVSAEPSPILLARVRAQIAAEPAPSRLFLPSWIPLAVGALAALAALALWLRPHAPPVPHPFHLAPEITSRAAPRPALPAEPAPAHTAANRARAHISSGSAKNAARQAALPEVLVPPGEWQAALQFVATLQRDPKRASVLAKSLERSRNPLEAADLNISSLEIAGLEGPEDLPRGGDNR